MNYVIAGAASGLFMASVFISVGSIILFIIAKNPTPTLKAVLVKVPYMTLVVGLVALSYPVWVIFGVALGLLYRAMEGVGPSNAFGSPNVLFTAIVVGATPILSVPPAILFRRVLVGVSVLAITFMGVFGWLLPLLAE